MAVKICIQNKPKDKVGRNILICSSSVEGDGFLADERLEQMRTSLSQLTIERMNKAFLNLKKYLC